MIFGEIILFNKMENITETIEYKNAYKLYLTFDTTKNMIGQYFTIPICVITIIQNILN